jgi:hypothetical protein
MRPLTADPVPACIGGLLAAIGAARIVIDERVARHPARPCMGGSLIMKASGLLFCAA